MAEWIQSRAFIGPRYEPTSSPYHFDWSALNLGATIQIADGSLSGNITNGATSFSFYYYLGWTMSKGGVWVAPNGSGQAWEYIQYATATQDFAGNVNVSGALRETAIEHNGIHSSGAVVRFWWPLDTMTGSFQINEYLNDDECIIDWDAEASGWLFPQAALRDRHLFLYQTRSNPSANFTNALVGFISNPNSNHNYEHVGQWSVKIVSSTGMINRYRVPAVRRGTYSVALGGSVTASPELGAAWKARASRDYLAAQPDLSAGNITDGDKSSVWISDQYVGVEPTHYVVNVGTVNDPSLERQGGKIPYGCMLITEFHLALPVGQPGGYRYVELTTLDDQTWTGRDVWLATENPGESVSIKSYVSAIEKNKTIIICENEDKFRQEHPAANPDAIIDLRKTGVPNLLANRPLGGGALGIYYAGNSQGWYQVAAWGTGSQASIYSAYTGSPTTQYSPVYPGTTLAVPTPGQTAVYNYANSATAKDNWTVSLFHTPGYNLGGSKVFNLIELPPMGLTLNQDINSGFTGICYLSDGTGAATAGLPISGEIQIGDERITYNNRTAQTINITARSVGGTTADDHVIGDTIYIYESGLAIDAFPLRAIKLIRNNTIIPKDFTLRTCKIAYTPRDPSDSQYAGDYDFLASVTGNTSQSVTYNFPATRRVRYLLIEYDAMSSTIARARINEIQAIPDETYFDSSLWLSGGETSSQFARQILLNAGAPSGAITANSTLGSGDHATSERLAWDVIAQYAAYAGLYIDVDRSSKIIINQNSYLTGDIFTTSRTWMLSNTAALEYSPAAPEPVSQVRIPWRSNGGESGTVSYPAVPTGTGEPLELPEQIYENQSQAQARAEKLYFRRKYPYSWVAEPASSGQSLRPGAFHILSDWKLNSEMQPIDRLVWAKSIEHTIEQDEETAEMYWRSAVQMMEIQKFNE